LGFDVPDRFLEPIRYNLERTAPEDSWLDRPEQDRLDQMLAFLFTKFSHWSYEEEVRQLFRLTEVDAATGRYFQDFSNDLVLAEVLWAQTQKSQLNKSQMPWGAARIICQSRCLAWHLSPLLSSATRATSSGSQARSFSPYAPTPY